MTTLVEGILAEGRERPAPMLTADVAEAGGRLGLVELNRLGCSWLRWG